MGQTTDLIFVTGASRSGTTLVSRILGAHPRVHGLTELHYFGDLWQEHHGKAPPQHELARLAAVLLARQQRDLWGAPPDAAELQRGSAIARELPADRRTGPGLFLATVQAIARDAGKSIPCEQTPRNIFYARRLLEWYPQAHIVHLVRDPRAVLASQKNRWRLRRLGARHIPWAETLRTWVNYHPITMCRLWNQAAEAADALRDHPRFHLLRFEALVGDPETTVRDLCRFIGVEFEAGMLDVPLWGSSNVNHEDTRRGVAPVVADRWTAVLNRAELAVCERTTAPMAHRLGYVLPKAKNGRLVALARALTTYPFHMLGVVAVNPHRAWVQARALFLGR